MSDDEYGCEYCQDGARTERLIQCATCRSLTCPNCRVSLAEAKSGRDFCNHWPVPSAKFLAGVSPLPERPA
jgi:uncharacterized Zn finger protein (UPF0148 family)